MKFIHLSDLHIGKTVNGFSMMEDQRFILEQIIQYTEEFSVDAVIIAGDVYDKATPSAEAVQVYDRFITELSRRNIILFIISGNHDSPERLSFGSQIMQSENIYIAGVFSGLPFVITHEDNFGPIHFHLLPFIKPAMVRHCYPEAEIQDYQSAVHTVLANHVVDTSQRNVLVAHQFVVALGIDPERSDSEITPVGGLENVGAELFEAFDYVALGHLHGPQKIGSENIRYAGSPLKYSFSETNQKKSITLVELNEKGAFSYSLLPLTPLRDMRKIAGPLTQLTAPEIVNAVNTQDYLQVTLTDRHELVEPMAKLRAVYPNVMELHYDNARTSAQSGFDACVEIENKSPFELFNEFYAEQNGLPLEKEQLKMVLSALEIAEDNL